MNKNIFEKQVQLMLECFPQIFPSPIFALKGGTAINFFERNMPRLSVDIDLTYLPLKDRSTSLQEIGTELKDIAYKINKNLSSTSAVVNSTGNKIIVSREGVDVKIEPNFVLRGSLFPVRVMEICEKAQKQFEFAYDVPVLSFEDLYGGKICAALDRQHPRDLFDVKYLFENKGITDSLREGFITYLLSHPRPIHEVIHPHELDIEEIYNKEFLGMVKENVPLSDLVEIRKRLIKEINSSLTSKEKEFILSFQDATPDWSKFPHVIKDLPAIKWKLINLEKLKSENTEKHVFMANQLKEKLGG
ncbi:MAG: nucleotidyl transferase AbiEii/AbiGii toxin family protein [Bdellovibrionaceae bacterium]|nr:nucleotidyl transferase AbiEii/AbiGii toxin family protein [Pseudobdellovibrionaceae bacterium]